MGSAQSRAQNRDRETSQEDTRAGIRRRFEPLRRLSTLGSLGGRRRVKRDRAQSTSPPEDGGKRQRLSEEEDEQEDNVGVAAPDWDVEEGEGSRTVEMEMETSRSRLQARPTTPQSQPLPQLSPSIHTQTPALLGPDLRSIIDQPAPPPIHYPIRRADEVVNEPLQLAGRRSNRTPIWHSAVSVCRRRSRSAITKSPSMANIAPLRRTRSEPAIGNPLIPLPPSDTLEARSHRLRVEEEYLEGTVALLQEQLETARRDMAAAEVEATAARERLRRLDDEAARLPGAVMMIQGIAQTHVPAPAERRRRFGRRPRGTAEGEREIPFEEQADTIIGLIIVSSLATANTLLSSQRPRPPPNDMIQNLMRRIQPGRAFAVDNILANSDQTQNADPPISNPAPPTRRSLATTSQPLPSTEPETAITGENYNAPPEFYGWLHGLQDNIRESIREFMGNTSLALSRTTSTLEPPVTSATRPDPMRRISAPTPANPVPSAPTPSQETRPEGTVPQFHTQPSQNNAPGTDAGNPAVTTDENGNRRLNFFRAYIFPSTDDEDPTANVPCLFVGVRSTSQDAGTLGQDLANNPSYAFGNNQPAPTTDESAMSVEEQVVDPTPTPGRPTPSRTQTLRSRLLALSPFSQQAPEESAPSPAPEPAPTATYIMYVIGGNYPRNHPVLTIPGLLTGEPLSDEEMARIGELLGEVKPPTATAEEVEKSGLRVIDASEIPGLVERKEVVDSSAERCLVCLSDFEVGEECRLLSCRHVFHKECVDQWIKVGRNACPACRTEAVDRTKSKTEESTTNTMNPNADVSPSDLSAADHAPAV